MTDFKHQAYGLRKDGTIGPEQPGNPVATYMVIPRSPISEDEIVRYFWSDGTTGPVQRPGTVQPL